MDLSRRGRQLCSRGRPDRRPAAGGDRPFRGDRLRRPRCRLLRLPLGAPHPRGSCRAAFLHAAHGAAQRAQPQHRPAWLRACFRQPARPDEQDPRLGRSHGRGARGRGQAGIGSARPSRRARWAPCLDRRPDFHGAHRGSHRNGRGPDRCGLRGAPRRQELPDRQRPRDRRTVSPERRDFP